MKDLHFVDKFSDRTYVGKDTTVQDVKEALYNALLIVTKLQEENIFLKRRNSYLESEIMRVEGEVSAAETHLEELERQERGSTLIRD